MTGEARLNRLYRLDELRSHHTTDWLDQRLFIPPWAVGESGPRRVWLATPSGSPRLAFEDAIPTAPSVHDEGVRWLDYGVTDLPFGSDVLFRAWGLSPADAAKSILVVSSNTELELANATLADAERMLWGLAREDVGHSAVFPSRMPAGEPATFRLEYTNGPGNLPAGSLLRFSVPRMFSMPQVDKPDAPGFTQIISADAGLDLQSIDLCFESHERVDIIFALGSDLPPHGRVQLTYHTAVTYLFESVWSREDMPQWYSPVPPLAVFVSTGDPECWVCPLPGFGHTLRFEAGPPTRLHLFLPGRRCMGSDVYLHGVATDRFRNPVRMHSADWQVDLTLEGEGNNQPVSLSEAVWTDAGAFRLQLPELAEGIYRVAARSRIDGSLVARSNPLEIIPESSVDQQLFWGHLHTHSDRSDGVRTFRQLYEHARDVGALEFVAAADHNDRLSDNDWLQMQDIAKGFHKPGVFCALCGLEWKDTCIYTHRDSLERPQRLSKELMPVYRGRDDVVLGPHGHVNHLGPLAEHDEQLQRFMQVYGTFGGCDAWDNPFLNPLKHSKGKPEAVATDILAQGYKLGFTGGGDIHSAHPGFSAELPGSQGEVACDQYHSHLYHDGLTAAVMPALGRKPLIEALQQRRTYATSGPRILLEFTVSGIPMGGEGHADRAECRLTVHAVTELDYVDIVKDGKVAWTQKLEGLDAVNLTWVDPLELAGEHFFYLRVKQTDGDMAWSSPVWVRRTQT